MANDVTEAHEQVVADRLPGWAAAGVGILAGLFVLVSLYPSACDDAGSRCTTWVGVVLGFENTTVPVIVAVVTAAGLWWLLRSVPRTLAVAIVVVVVLAAGIVVWLVWFPQPLSGQELIDKCAAVGKVPHVDGGGGCMYPPGTKLP